jgi:A/G-specific adenine glycosylase
VIKRKKKLKTNKLDRVSINPTALTANLLSWYHAEHRDLPWRRTTDPYEIWVSEVMLQQTQVQTVLPYYARFLAALPSVQHLAEAPLEQVIKLWEGLGYYARARNMHQAAQLVMSKHAGVFPNLFADILALPGIGQSTAGAVSTFAFATPYPILDGNVKRVLSRVYGIETSLEDKAVIQTLWGHSSNLLPSEPEDAYSFNQAIMELGATVCLPKNPKCPDCPWAAQCVALAENKMDRIPLKKLPKVTPHYTIALGVIWKGDELLIALRPAEGLLANLWEFPGGKCEASESLVACVAREIHEETGLTVSVGAKIVTVKHAYTHFKITLHAFECQYVSGEALPKASQEIRWITIDALDTYAFPKANLKVIAALKANFFSRQLQLLS